MVAVSGLRICKLHFVASDSLEQVIMPTESNRVKPPLALRSRDAAKALGISPRKLWQMTKDGQIPFVKVGRVVLYPTAELRDWLSRKAK